MTSIPCPECGNPTHAHLDNCPNVPLPRFTIDGWSRDYPAVSYGPLWNGWATPVVTQTVLTETMDEFPDWNHVEFRWDGSAVITIKGGYPDDDDQIVIAPDSNGNYDLAAMGYTYEQV